MTTRLTPEQKRLAADNYPLAKYLARVAYNKNREQLDLDELTSVAYEGLVGAASRFDPSQVSAETLASGKAFAAFARTRINGAIIDWQRSQDHVTRSTRALFKTMTRLGLKPEETGRADLERISRQAGITVERALEVIREVLGGPLSADGVLILEERSGAVEQTRRTTQWDAASDTESDASASFITSGVVTTIRSLPPLQQHIVALRYYSGFDLQVIGAHLGVSMDAIRQNHAEAVEEIHAAMVRAAQH